jgi:hypothetical protein
MIQDPSFMCEIELTLLTNWLSELAEYLYLSHFLSSYVELYVTVVSPQKTPVVIGRLFELAANEDFIDRLMVVACYTFPFAPRASSFALWMNLFISSIVPPPYSFCSLNSAFIHAGLYVYIYFITLYQ